MNTAERARPGEQTEAFRLLFRHLPEDEQRARCGRAQELLDLGDLDPDGLLVVRGRAGLCGCMVAVPLAGAGGLVWPPQAAAGPEQTAVENQLVRAACNWLHARGAKLAQALIAPDEIDQGAPLERNGFVHVTCLQYLRHALHAVPSQPAGTVTFETYRPEIRPLFLATMERTYQGTLDCPELNGVRTLDEILEGHRLQGRFDPQCWLLARDGGRPVGVLLVTELEEGGSWDLSYLGVVPEARGQGLGRLLTVRALQLAAAAHAPQLALAVDLRNQPARNLYETLGFEPAERREVFLRIPLL